ncbi:hybrid sensor histidine kinase/response regulator [Dissulfurispira thermophila]|uniref:Chemotaxis protein CheA n=1 Tax=Dissulfurispira thermophila TaxID=2715679 RepID=A0A7G1GYC6_9BACT|nr:hybrid sensor histidine kinase/response regulator [Dissulfurispira thermophila]BCB95188.1 hybrid sensor histidine kinase/response regulator [Dissulfurispira thermophila]
MAIDMKKFIARFVEEAREHINKLNDGFVLLEKNPDDKETINAVFRSAHTIKGSSRMMKLTQISETAHKLEDVLGAVRDSKITLSKETFDLIFSAVDAISNMVEKTALGQEITDDNTALCEALAAAAKGSKTDITADKPAPQSESPKTEPAVPQALPTSSIEPKVEVKTTVKTPPATSETLRISANKLDRLIKLMEEIVSTKSKAKTILHDIKSLESAAKRQLELISQKAQSNTIVTAFTSLISDIKDLVSMINDYSTISSLLSDELRSTALTLRMVPLSMVFDSMPRMVRDLSRTLGKDIDIIIEGSEIELDKQIVDRLAEPILHLIRNAIDHGLEPADERKNANKPAKGTIRLSASYDAASVLIDVRDDGRGIDKEKIKEKALRKKMFTAEEIEAMSDIALMDLIFQPGFSTSAIVTDVSGRGVGLDVVKKTIVEDLKGSISIETALGSGTAFHIRLPLTLAIMRLLLISASGITFAIPAQYVKEVLRVPETEFMDVLDKKAIRLRNEFIPVERLSDILKCPDNKAQQAQKMKKTIREPLIMIIHAVAEKLGLIIDELIDEEDMVIKPFPLCIKKTGMSVGVTISGRNKVVNVLNISAVIDAIKNLKGSVVKERQIQERALNILVVDDSINTREIEKSILESYGYKVDLAEDGMDGLNKAMKFKYDAVITDVEMPLMDGFSLTERLRAEESYKDTPIIIVTSRSKEDDKMRGIRVGADAYIVKGSFDQNNLIETLQNLVGFQQT